MADDGVEAYYAVIVDLESGEVVKRLGPYSERRAEKMADAMSNNLNHERFMVGIRSVHYTPASGATS